MANDNDFAQVRSSHGNLSQAEENKAISQGRQSSLVVRDSLSVADRQALLGQQTSVTNQSQAPVLGRLSKLGLCGMPERHVESKKKRYFSFPEDLDVLMARGEALPLQSRMLQKITCGIYEAISSIQLHFSDGTDSGMIGTSSKRQQLICALDVPLDEVITGVRMRHSPSKAAIQNITFDTDEGTEIEFNAKMSDGTWAQQSLETGQLIVGCYGTLWVEHDQE